MSGQFVGGSFARPADAATVPTADYLWTPSGIGQIIVNSNAVLSAVPLGNPQAPLAAFFKAGTGAGNFVQDVAFGAVSVPCATLQNANSFTTNVAYTPGGVGAGSGPDIGVENPIWKIRTRMRRRIVLGSGLVPTLDFGFCLGPNGTGNLGLFSVTAPGFGIVGDAAGGWKAVARKTVGGAIHATALSWPVAVTTFADLEIKYIPDSPADGQKIEVRVNDTLLHTERFDGGFLPDSQDGPSSAVSWVFAVRNTDVPVGGQQVDLQFTYIRFRIAAD